MDGRTLRTSLHEGRLALGSLVVSPSPRWLGAISGSGLDFVFIDTEHIPLDRHQLSWMCLGYAARGLAPIVRIPAPDPYQAAMAVDAGAHGVVAPYIEHPDQIRALVGAVKHRPLKGERLAGILAGREPVTAELAAYLDGFNPNAVVIANIESLPAMARLPELCTVPGLDAALIGPHDLSVQLGMPEAWDDPRFLDAVRTILRTARDAGIGAGIHHWVGVERMREYVAWGANLLIDHGDVSLVAEQLRRRAAAIRGSAVAATAGEAV